MSRTKIIKINHQEASWIEYCLNYVDECYSYNEYENNKERKKEILRGKKFIQKLHKIFGVL